MKKALFISAFAGLAALVFATDTGFERYQPIVDRLPFGKEPPGEEIVRVAVSQSFARQLRLSMLFEGPDGDVRAGIVDTAGSKSYILRPGESKDGLELVEADLQSSEAMLRKGNEMALLKLESGAAAPLSRSQQASRQTSYAERRSALLKKIEERRKQTQEPPEPRLTGEVLKKHLEEVQMNAIREGLPPLPLPLTPEMDAQLVSEGVLPPQ